jgi:hypothetical protein
MNVLEKYLSKIGVKHFYELNTEEKATYRNWEASLNGRKITDEEIVSFFQTEAEDTINKLVSKKYNEEDDRFLKVKLDFLRKVQNFLKMPEYEKKIVEQGINKLLQ